MFTTYILFSQKIQKFYTGYTSMEVQDRLVRHLYNKKGFTAKADDWKVIYTVRFETKRKQ